MKEHFLTILRDRSIDCLAFRAAAAKLSELIASEIGAQIGPNKRIILIPILRAGLALLPPFQKMFANAPIGILGIRRDEETALPHLYYEKLPRLAPNDRILLLDPMLATGGSASLALDRLEAHGANLSRTTLVGVIASQEGFKAVKKHCPQVHIYTVAIDEKLDFKKYIVPGLGDFGDRYFGTD
jgi:uracil phosphoribosyltransferase